MEEVDTTLAMEERALAAKLARAAECKIRRHDSEGSNSEDDEENDDDEDDNNDGGYREHAEQH